MASQSVLKESSSVKRKCALTIVMQNLLDEIDMGEHHSTAAVSLESELRESVAFIHVVFQQLEVLVPFVANDLSTTEATHLVRQNRFLRWT